MLVDAGIRAGVGMAPLLPGISDRPEQLEAVVRAAREAGATGIWADLLNLRPGTREYFLRHLARDWPQELERYHELYAEGPYLRRRDEGEALGRVAALKRSHGIGDRRRVRLGPPPEPQQLDLVL
jgi:DNA repair photolyase